MIHQKIRDAKKEFFSLNQRYPEIIVLNYDTALMAFSNDSGGEMVCYDLIGKDSLSGMKLVVSSKLKNMEIIVGGAELIEKYG